MKIKKLSLIILTLSILVGSTQVVAKNSSTSTAKKIAKYALTAAKGVGAGAYGLLTGCCALQTLVLVVVSAKVLKDGISPEIAQVLSLPPGSRQQGVVALFMGSVVVFGALYTAASGYAAHKCMQSFLNDLTGEEETSGEGAST